MELSGIHPNLGIPTSIFPRFPPGINPLNLMGIVDQKRLKEKFFNDNASINSLNYMILVKCIKSLLLVYLN